MDTLVPLAEKVSALLTERRETVAVAESSTGGLVSAALLAVPGASAYLLDGGVIYTRTARSVMLGIPDEALAATRPVIAASPSPGQPSARSRWRRGARTASPICGRSPRPHWSCWHRLWQTDSPRSPAS